MAIRVAKQLTDEMLESAFGKFKEARKKPNSRFLSWEHCFSQFASIFEELRGGALSPGDVPGERIDYLCLHLGFFLASWGMLRGSTKLLQHDYKVHQPLVRAVLEYSDLYGKDLSDFCKDSGALERFGALCNDVVNYCSQFSNRNDGKAASDTLVGKIIMGTLGISPAYDKFVIEAVKEYGISRGRFNTKAFEEFAKYFTENHADITKRLTKDAKKLNPLYTRAKVIDSLLWFIGQDILKQGK